MCAFGNSCMTVGYRRGMMQMVVGVGQWDSQITILLIQKYLYLGSWHRLP